MAVLPAVLAQQAGFEPRLEGNRALMVDWPFGQIALRYLDRLAVTPVTMDEAKAAMRWLRRENLSDPLNRGQVRRCGLPGERPEYCRGDIGGTGCAADIRRPGAGFGGHGPQRSGDGCGGLGLA